MTVSQNCYGAWKWEEIEFFVGKLSKTIGASTVESCGKKRCENFFTSSIVNIEQCAIWRVFSIGTLNFFGSSSTQIIWCDVGKLEGQYISLISLMHISAF